MSNTDTNLTIDQATIAKELGSLINEYSSEAEHMIRRSVNSIDVITWDEATENAKSEAIKQKFSMITDPIIAEKLWIDRMKAYGTLILARKYLERIHRSTKVVQTYNEKARKFLSDFERSSATSDDRGNGSVSVEEMKKSADELETCDNLVLLSTTDIDESAKLVTENHSLIKELEIRENYYTQCDLAPKIIAVEHRIEDEQSD